MSSLLGAVPGHLARHALCLCCLSPPCASRGPINRAADPPKLEIRSNGSGWGGLGLRCVSISSISPQLVVLESELRALRFDSLFVPPLDGTVVLGVHGALARPPESRDREIRRHRFL
jgi:hypothetical protein